MPTPIRKHEGPRHVLLLLTDFQQAQGGIGTFNIAMVEALRRSLLAQGGQMTILSLNDRSFSGISEKGIRYRGFQRSRLAFVVQALKGSLHSDLVIFGHVHFAPLSCLMPRPQKWLVVHGIEVWKRLGVL